MKLTRYTLLTATMVGTGLIGIGVTQAGADPTAKQGAALNACKSAVTKRVDALNRAQEVLANDKHLTDAHESALEGIITSSEERINASKQIIDAGGNPEAVKAACKSVVEDNRVFAVVLPQVHIVRGADRIQHAIDKLPQIESKVNEVLAKADAAGKDTTAARAALATFNAAAAEVSVAGIADNALAVTPAAYNSDHSVLDAVRDALKAEAQDAKAARDAAKNAVAEVKALKG